jgi:hypothetical protein
MASNGLLSKAKTGRCRICQRVRNTNKHLKAVGEVLHGYATGRIWECIDEKECDDAAAIKLNTESTNETVKCRIRTALKQGRFTNYMTKV